MIFSHLEVEKAINLVYLLASQGKTINVVTEGISKQQIKSLHLWFRLVSEYLNDVGATFEIIGIECRYTEAVIKDMFKQIAKVLFEVDSSRDLTSKQMNEIFEYISKHLSEKTGDYIEFPSIEHFK